MSDRTDGSRLSSVGDSLGEIRPVPRANAGVGAGVNAILEAAEKAAEEITSTARREAAELIRQAE